MATNIVPQDWQQIEQRALELFTTNRNLEWDDSLLAALLDAKAPDLCRRALRLIEEDGNVKFSHAFKAVMMTERDFDNAAPLPFEEVRRAA